MIDPREYVSTEGMDLAPLDLTPKVLPPSDHTPPPSEVLEVWICQSSRFTTVSSAYVDLELRPLVEALDLGFWFPAEHHRGQAVLRRTFSALTEDGRPTTLHLYLHRIVAAFHLGGLDHVTTLEDLYLACRRVPKYRLKDRSKPRDLRWENLELDSRSTPKPRPRVVLRPSPVQPTRPEPGAVAGAVAPRLGGEDLTSTERAEHEAVVRAREEDDRGLVDAILGHSDGTVPPTLPTPADLAREVAEIPPHIRENLRKMGVELPEDPPR